MVLTRKNISRTIDIIMENLKINGTQEFMGINIPVIEGGFGN